MKRAFKFICLLLTLALLCGCGGGDALRESADCLVESAEKAGGGDWTVFALARSGHLPEGLSESFFARMEASLSGGGVKSTDSSRMALCVRALGLDPGDAAGFDLLAPLEDIDRAKRQGPAALAYALLALGGDCPAELREEYRAALTAYRLPDGGFAPKGENEADADLTAMVLTALAEIRAFSDVEGEISAALDVLSELQNPDGSFTSSDGVPTCESTAQVVIALCALNASPKADEGFVKEKSAFDALMGFFVSGGGFAHTAGGSVNIIATEQGLCALEAVSRFEDGRAALFDFSGEDGLVCSIRVECGELLENLSQLDKEKRGLVPENGIIYENENAAFRPGESVFDLLRREMKKGGVHLEFTLTPAIGAAYIEGISNLYEFDCGESSGWLYSVNGEYPGFSCSEYLLESGDAVVFEFVCSKREAVQ